jgi:low affinity Fe/Cu permease
MSKQPVDETANDWVRRPGTGLVWWCLPLGAGVAANYFASTSRATALVWMVSFVWMGTGCLLNARRCHRLHCYISGPAFFLGAVALVLLAHGFARLGPHSLNNIVGITLTVALLSFVPEMIWRKYL